MKKMLLGIIGLGVLFALLGCQRAAKQMEEMQHPKHEKIEDAQGILDKVLTHIAEHDVALSFENGELLDTELGIPRFEIVPVLENKHFEEKDIVDGFIVRPVVEVENPRILIVVEAVDKKASLKLQAAMGKVKADQYQTYSEAGMWTTYLIDHNKTIRQGNFLIYVTWESAADIVKIFEQHVR